MQVCIIPARGGSKRIPHKNIKLFCGKPIISYSIEAALKSGCFDKVIVSTDDPSIQRISEAAGAEVPFVRPEELSSDMVSVLATVKHAVEWLSNTGTKVEIVCLLYATAPFVDGDVLQNSLKAFKEDPEKKYCLGITEFRYPIQRSVYLTEEGGIRLFHPEHFTSRSQDLQRAYHDAGQFCWGAASAFIEESPVFESHTLPYILPAYRVQDIDTPDDWRHAELIYKTFRETEKLC